MNPALRGRPLNAALASRRRDLGLVPVLSRPARRHVERGRLVAVAIAVLVLGLVLGFAVGVALAGVLS